MGDNVYEYVMVGNSPPVTKYTVASAGQSTVMDNIAAAGDVVAPVILDSPPIVEFSSPTVEAGQSFVTINFKSSPITERVLFQTSDTRLAFLEYGLSQFARIKVAVGVPVEPEVIWHLDQFEAAINSDIVAMEEIEAAPDVQTRVILLEPSVKFVQSPTVRSGEVVVFMSFPDTVTTVRIYIRSALNFMQFIQHFVVPMATATAIISGDDT